MRAVATDLTHLLFAVPFYILCLLMTLAVLAFWRSRQSMLYPGAIPCWWRSCSPMC